MIKPTDDQAIRDFQEAYEAFWGIERPPVRKVESGGFDVRYRDGSRRYTKRHLVAVTGMMLSLKHEVA